MTYAKGRFVVLSADLVLPLTVLGNETRGEFQAVVWDTKGASLRSCHRYQGEASRLCELLNAIPQPERFAVRGGDYRIRVGGGETLFHYAVWDRDEDELLSVHRYSEDAEATCEMRETGGGSRCGGGYGVTETPKTCSDCPNFCVTATPMNEWICMHPRWQGEAMRFRVIGAPGVRWGINATKGTPVWCPLRGEVSE